MLVEELQELRVHVVDGLEEGEHGAVVGDAAPAHVVALHAVQEGGDCVLQSFEELLVVLLRFSVLVLLLRKRVENESQLLLKAVLLRVRPSAIFL